MPAAAAAAASAIEVVKSTEGEVRRSTLWQRVSELKSKLNIQTSNDPAPIIPLHIGDEARALEVAAVLLDKHILIPAVRYPTVARGKARLRLTISAAHTSAQIQLLASALQPLVAQFRNLPFLNEHAGQA